MQDIGKLGELKNIEEKGKREKIVLTMMPYWTPLIPPQGISMLKTFLQDYGYIVKCLDPNVEEVFKELYYGYFNAMRSMIPEEKHGNFFNIGHDILQNHMMAAIKYTDEKEYEELIKVLVYKTYYSEITSIQSQMLIKIMKDFYIALERYTIEFLDKEKPDVLGFSLLKGNVPASIFAARLAKKISPGIRVVGGGGTFSDSHVMGSPSFEAFIEETRDCFDKIMVAGQGELLFLRYLEGDFPEEQRVITLKDIDNEKIPFCKLKVSDLSDLNVIYYPYLAATGSSSCPNKCSFCNASKFWGEYNTKDVKQTVDEMITQYKKYGNQLFFMTDSLLNPIIGDLAKEFIGRDIALYYDCYFRIDNPSSFIDNTLLWRKGGMYRARIGVESGSQHVLDMMHKGITVEETKKSITALAYAGIKTTAYIVIGHPGETEEDFQMTLDLLAELKNELWQAECNPFYYHYSGQFDSDEWACKRQLLYPEKAKKMLVFDTWTLDMYPNREIRYDRMYRFVEHCKKLGIPNPYTASEIYEADERWKRLHRNAVPSVMEFKNNGCYIDDTKNVKKIYTANTKLDDGMEFDL